MSLTDLKPLRVVLVVVVAGVAFMAGRASVQRISDPTVPVYHHPLNNFICRDPAQITAALEMLAGIETGDPARLREARSQLTEVLRTADMDSEVHTYIWLVDLLLAAPGVERERHMADPDGARVVRYLGGEGLPALAPYLRAKHGLAEVEDREALRDADELMRFMSPARDGWEKPDALIAAMGLKPGQHITDLGAGPGYFTWRFAEAVGPDGQAHAVEMNLQYVGFLKQVVAYEGLSQVTIHQTDGSTIEADPGSMDHVFMSTAFQTIYARQDADTRRGLIEEIRASLRPGGRLTITENAMLSGGGLRARGILLSRAVVITYLEASGFRLIASHAFVPQRYTLIFEPN